MARGIETRHQRGCRALDGGARARCSCTPSFRAWIWDQATGRRIRKTFPTHAAAKTWRQDSLVALRQGKPVVTTTKTVREAGDDWLRRARAGEVRTRGGRTYKPSAVRAYEQALRLRVYPVLGERRLGDVRRGELQRFVEQLKAQKDPPLAESTIEGSVLPLRAIYRDALRLEEVDANPTTGLEIPRKKAGRDRIVTPAQAEALLSALVQPDRALWATALYAGLRRGELLALEWEDVDLKRRLIHVRRSWDPKEKRDVGPKTDEGERKVPMASRLHQLLAEHRLSTVRRDGVVFAGADGCPLAARSISDRADDAWKAAGLDRITLHEARHTYASLMIAAGVNAKALSTYMGHANISITMDRYGHLMPGNEDQAAGLLDAYLSREQKAAAAT